MTNIDKLPEGWFELFVREDKFHYTLRSAWFTGGSPPPQQYNASALDRHKEYINNMSEIDFILLIRPIK